MLVEVILRAPYEILLLLAYIHVRDGSVVVEHWACSHENLDPSPDHGRLPLSVHSELLKLILARKTSLTMEWGVDTGWLVMLHAKPLLVKTEYLTGQVHRNNDEVMHTIVWKKS